MVSPRTIFMSFLLIAMFPISSLISIVGHLRTWPGSLPQELLALDLAARLRVDSHSTALASTDFGQIISASPAAVLYPISVHDIAALVRFSYSSSQSFTIAPRGLGHSLRGQAFAPKGVVIELRSLNAHVDDGKPRASVSSRESIASYVDAGGEQLWIDVLHETLKHGLAPRSWTDYLYLTVGGTLSNAGVSGQAFLHGPQISNVYELDVITGKGEMVTCSKNLHSELFYAVLGGLGQFGIITRARIALEPAPQRVRWVRLIYTDFGTFTRDQEQLISPFNGGTLEEKKRGFQYVEGSLLMDHSLINNWRSSSFFSKRDLERISTLAAKHRTVYCLEGAVNYDLNSASSVDQELELLLEELNYVPGFAFTKDVSYVEFLNRVRDGELKLRSRGLWDVPHPWLNLFVPKSRILDFDLGVFKGILRHNNSMGPILIYPMNKSRWDGKMSAVIPDEEIFYSIGLLRSAVHDLDYMQNQNMEILRFCDGEGIDCKQYLPHYRTRADWMKHFGPKWNTLLEMKLKYDPKALLSPGQGIFTSPLQAA